MLRGSRIVLGSYPTPVSRIGERLWVKRDDLTSALYGGNKVRKLELLLGAARDAGKTRILTLGAVGSHQVVATALYGAREGFVVDAILVPQPSSPHAELNVRVALAQGVHALACPAWSLAPAYVAARWGSDAYFIPLGGSNALGSLGFVDAAHELAAQVRAGELPEPDVVVVAMGSGGTAAGLAVGFEQAGLRTRVLGVAVAPPTPVLRHMARRLAQKTAAMAGLPVSAGLRAAKRIDVEGKWIGRGYGRPTDEGRAAMEVAKGLSSSLTLDATYTAKAFACALDVSGSGSGSESERAWGSARGSVLYWHTLSTAPLETLLGEGDARDAPLPRAVAALLK
ncbi:MAG: Bifunctional protein: zinc-containing alcohol dehydrogenase [Myxococcaceae bacterium]|nr:Bifunctional protein: zinc-containing alcohol dehydrogenase [Myxococcaceae bacterium]